MYMNPIKAAKSYETSNNNSPSFCAQRLGKQVFHVFNHDEKRLLFSGVII